MKNSASNLHGPYYISNDIAIHPAFAYRLAELNYSRGTDRADFGSLVVAPLAWASWNAPVGLLVIYASTNGDPVVLGQIEGGEVVWTDAARDDFAEVLFHAVWNNPYTTDAAYALEVLVAQNLPPLPETRG